jgi:hypothetical protein
MDVPGWSALRWMSDEGEHAMSDDGDRGAWPPGYADPITLRLRFVPHQRRERPFPAQVGSRSAWAAYVSDADAVEALRRLGIGSVDRQSAPEMPTTRSRRPDEVLAQSKQAVTADAHVVRVQELLLTPREPLLLTDPPKEFMERIPRLSGKDAAKYIPSWARGNPPRVGETPDQYARRLLDEHYEGKWNGDRGANSEYSKIKKGYRGYRNPRSMPVSPDLDDKPVA